jgi:sulfur carrier protein ThiS
MAYLDEPLHVRVRGHGRLSGALPGAQAVELTGPCHVSDLLERLGVSTSELWIVLVNAESASHESELHDGDCIDLIPPLGGG